MSMLQTTKIGIVVTNKGDETISGYLAELQIKLVLDTNSNIHVEAEILKTYFNYNLYTGNVNTCGGTLEKELEIVTELNKIGFTNAKSPLDPWR